MQINHNKIRLIFALISFLTLSNLVLAADRSIQLVKKSANETQQTNRTALIIGNSKYKQSPLKNPVNDAKDIARVVRSLDFDTELLLNANQVEISKAISKFGRKLRERGGAGLFYFAGHGMQVNGTNYLIPVGDNIQEEDEVEFKAVNSGLVLAKMESAKNPLNIVILDACRDNPFARSYRSGKKGLAQMEAPKGSLIIYATSPGNVASDGKGRNGIFTKHLLKHIETPSLDIVMTMRNVRIGVSNETGGKQIPWAHSSLHGAFSFNPTGQAQQLPLAASINPTQPSATSVESSRGIWRSDYEYDVKVKEVRGNNSYQVHFTAGGRSEAADPISRKIRGERNALKKIKKLMMADLTRAPYKLTSDEIDELHENGETIDLSYENDGRNVELIFEVIFPVNLIKKLKP